MELNQYIASLRDTLTAAASAGDDQTKRTAGLLAAAVEPAARLALMNALADLAAEVTASLDDRIVEVRLDGQDVRVVVTDTATDDEPDEQPAAPPPPMFDADGDISRITVRLLEQLKGRAEEAAAAQGVSLNSFVSQAVQGALYNAGRSGGWGGPGGGNWGQNWGQRGDWGRGERGDRERGRNRDDNQRGKSSRVRGWVEG